MPGILGVGLGVELGLKIGLELRSPLSPPLQLPRALISMGCAGGEGGGGDSLVRGYRHAGSLCHLILGVGGD